MFKALELLRLAGLRELEAVTQRWFIRPHAVGENRPAQAIADADTGRLPDAALVVHDERLNEFRPLLGVVRGNFLQEDLHDMQLLLAEIAVQVKLFTVDHIDHEHCRTQWREQTDHQTSAEYRRDLVRAMVRRSLEQSAQ